ncbi:hypothetical protein Lesp02_72770 [Lentzea sp. NBRC 105346]|uniref:hypothetical protein n=1 Tax=Lentzea sp. NBRC 105346 TaxID=3032205 RepID=UPI0024A53D2F|nr:hypothetical protein [Lentzea sp. NBRC 105346]GLZ35090.1 hypothetical protein Lesp02_72770 [Lentzea sp. NBRC 105346]
MSTTTHPDLLVAKAQYETSFGWRVEVDSGHGRLVMRAGWDLDAVILPARLAHRALAELRFTMLEGPVVATPGGQWLTFLTTLAATRQPTLPLELRRSKAQAVPRGGQVVLPQTPSTRTDIRDWQWVVAPRQHRSPPPWCTVIAAARRAARW